MNAMERMGENMTTDYVNGAAFGLVCFILLVESIFSGFFLLL